MPAIGVANPGILLGIGRLEQDQSPHIGVDLGRCNRRTSTARMSRVEDPVRIDQALEYASRLLRKVLHHSTRVNHHLSGFIMAPPAIPVGVDIEGEGIIDRDADDSVGGDEIEQAVVTIPVEPCAVMKHQQRCRLGQSLGHEDLQSLEVQLGREGRNSGRTAPQWVRGRPDQLMGVAGHSIDDLHRIRAGSVQRLTGDHRSFEGIESGPATIEQGHASLGVESPKLQLVHSGCELGSGESPILGIQCHPHGELLPRHQAIGDEGNFGSMDASEIAGLPGNAGLKISG